MKSRTRLMLHSIQSLYYQMQSGKLVVPAFQRRFSWSKSQVRSLLESIYRGFPIGTLLVLEEQAGRLPTLSVEESLFPELTSTQLLPHYRVWYVLDGSQRLSALYNTFFGNRPEFACCFDLETKEFVHGQRGNRVAGCVRLRDLYSSDGLSELLLQRSRSDSSGELFDTYNRLHTAFRDYDIPIQVLLDMSMDEAMEVYERVNSAGRRLTRKDLDRIRRINTDA